MTDDQLEKILLDKQKDMRITCPVALAIAKELGVSPAKVGEALDRIGVKVTSCQLGCFG
jgi:hypothetical protein